MYTPCVLSRNFSAERKHRGLCGVSFVSKLDTSTQLHVSVANRLERLFKVAITTLTEIPTQQTPYVRTLR